MAITTGKGTIYGARYYWVKPLGWMLNGDNASYSEMVQWNVEQFGNTKWDAGKETPIPGQRWYSSSARFWFKDKDDFAYFLLRWS
jgi:hypothetical protein